MTSDPLPEKGIDDALLYCIGRAEGDGLPLQEALDRLGPASFCFVCLLLSVPFLQPFSLGPLTMASGITFMAAGWQMTRRGGVVQLPKVMQATRLQGKGWVTILRLCEKTLRFCRRFTRPRLQSWVLGSFGERFVGWLLLIGGFLLAIPFANLPLNNTFPALMILFAAIAWLERDGLMIVISLFWGVVTLAYFATFGSLAYYLCCQAWSWLHHFWQ